MLGMPMLPMPRPTPPRPILQRSSREFLCYTRPRELSGLWPTKPCSTGEQVVQPYESHTPPLCRVRCRPQIQMPTCRLPQDSLKLLERSKISKSRFWISADWPSSGGASERCWKDVS